MSSITFKITKLAWAAIAIYWAIIALFMVLDPALPPNVLVEPWGLDVAAVTIFIVAIMFLLYLVYNLVARARSKPTNTIKMLLITCIAFIGALAMSLLVEFLFTIDLVNNFLTRTIFIFTAIGLVSWYLFIIDIFDNGLYLHPDKSVQARGQYLTNWIKVVLLFSMIVVFLYYLALSVWRPLSIVETLLETVPVVAIAIYDTISLLVKPVKLLRNVEAKVERIGLLALLLSGMALLGFMITFILYNLSGIGLAPQDGYHARNAYYYVSMILIPVYCALTYLGIIYPVKNKWTNISTVNGYAS
jgi:hypothetical protein